MSFSDSHGEMPPVEQHGIQLRMAVDRLVPASDDYAFEAIAAVMTAEELLEAIHRATNR